MSRCLPAKIRNAQGPGRVVSGVVLVLYGIASTRHSRKEHLLTERTAALSAAALFVFFATAAGTRIVAADSGTSLDRSCFFNSGCGFRNDITGVLPGGHGGRPFCSRIGGTGGPPEGTGGLMEGPLGNIGHEILEGHKA